MKKCFATDAEFRAIFDSGATPTKIAKILHLRVGTVRYHYKRLYGVPLRRFRRLAPTFVAPSDIATLAYMAGIIDGEGWITRSGRTWQVCFSNTDKGLVEFFERFGGLTGTRPMKTHGRIKSVKTQYYWRVARSVDVISFLSAISPFMLVKKGIAEKALSETMLRLTRSDVDDSGVD